MQRVKSFSILFFLASLVLRSQQAVSIIRYGLLRFIVVYLFNLCLSSA
nr:MAG TPA: hypothetical protein [Caudoviricetes sp.]